MTLEIFTVYSIKDIKKERRENGWESHMKEIIEENLLSILDDIKELILRWTE